ncbi:MAG: SGNH/GDSL hydrolase family protein [Patescibacteria group bacterium]|jgi:lysophospholipase L1-like esterase
MKIIAKKRILCFGDSNTWGWVPFSMGAKRYSLDKRWTGILQKSLGDDYEIIEEGLGGRTTMFDDPRPEFPQRNGLQILPIILETHLPLDYVILMLGTTDTKEMFNLSSQKTTKGMQKIIQTIKNYRVLEGFSSPQILLIVPPIVVEETDFASKLFKGASEKSKKLVKFYKELSKQEKILYLDPTQEVKVDQKEGIHIDETNHEKLAKLIYEKIK